MAAEKKPKSNRADSSSPSASELEKFVEIMNRHDLVELEWEKAGERVRLVRAGKQKAGTAAAPYGILPAAVAPTPVSNPVQPASPAAPAVANPPANPKKKEVPSPFVGTFYRAASPESDPYVREGQVIKRGDILCIIEAMKLMNEIESELAGKIVSVLVENGQPVEFGEPLFVIELP
ncbi:MAG: acetyl-CoA carboxylase biotin carboxyl carrier protein [Bdellovibrionota bacterium]